MFVLKTTANAGAHPGAWQGGADYSKDGRHRESNPGPLAPLSELLTAYNLRHQGRVLATYIFVLKNKTKTTPCRTTDYWNR